MEVYWVFIGMPADLRILDKLQNAISAMCGKVQVRSNLNCMRQTLKGTEVEIKTDREGLVGVAGGWYYVGYCLCVCIMEQRKQEWRTLCQPFFACLTLYDPL